MAVDTVCIKSPYISQDLAIYLKYYADMLQKEARFIGSGVVKYMITTGSLEGSFDHRISFRVDNKEYKVISVNASTLLNSVNIGKKSFRRPQLVETDWYVQIEGSVHKAMIGHNIYGGPDDFNFAVKWLVNELEKQYNCTLPDYNLWEVRRVDTAEVFRLGSFEQCSEWFRGLNSCDFPRRTVNRYGLTGLYASGSTTTLKFYHKGPEFDKHDKKRLRKFLHESKLLELQAIANSIIRVEVEIKSDKLVYDYGHYPLVYEVSNSDLKRIYDTEVRRLLKEGAADMNTVRKAVTVEKRLRMMYGPRRGGLLFGTWLKLSTFGEKALRASMNDRTFRWHKSKLIDAGCAWTGTDVMVKILEIVPPDFSPVLSDSRRLVITPENAIDYMKKAACQ